MKKCKKCGAVQENDNTTCIDCGSVLGAPVNETEQSMLEEEISDRVESMSETTADFYISAKDKVIGIIAIALVIASIVMMVIIANALDRIDDVWKDKYQQSSLWFLGSAMFLAGAAIFFLAPKFLCWSYTRRIRYIANIERLEPSASYLFLYKIAKYIPFVAGCVLFAVALISIIPMI